MSGGRQRGGAAYPSTPRLDSRGRVVGGVVVGGGGWSVLPLRRLKEKGRGGGGCGVGTSQGGEARGFHY